jgi:hypothetical protein
MTFVGYWLIGLLALALNVGLVYALFMQPKNVPVRRVSAASVNHDPPRWHKDFDDAVYPHGLTGVQTGTASMSPRAQASKSVSSSR